MFNALGGPYAWRTGLLRIQNQVIELRCETGENCGANFWIKARTGVAHLRYSLNGAGGLYAIPVDEQREIAEISRFGVRLEHGANRTAQLPFQFDNEAVKGVVVGIRLNEGLPNARPTGELIVTGVEVDNEALPDVEPPAHPEWLILVPVTTAATEALVRTFKFVVIDLGPSPDAAGAVRGTSVENAIENSIENIIFTRVNHRHMFELRVSRTAFVWPNAQNIGGFPHAGRRYEIRELINGR